jgi:hypothetical protein
MQTSEQDISIRELKTEAATAVAFLMRHGFADTGTMEDAEAILAAIMLLDMIRTGATQTEIASHLETIALSCGILGCRGRLVECATQGVKQYF